MGFFCSFYFSWNVTGMTQGLNSEDGAIILGNQADLLFDKAVLGVNNPSLQRKDLPPVNLCCFVKWPVVRTT